MSYTMPGHYRDEVRRAWVNWTTGEVIPDRSERAQGIESEQNHIAMESKARAALADLKVKRLAALPPTVREAIERAEQLPPGESLYLTRDDFDEVRKLPWDVILDLDCFDGTFVTGVEGIHGHPVLIQRTEPHCPVPPVSA